MNRAPHGQRFAQSCTQALYTLGGLAGQRAIQAERLPPGHPDGEGPGGVGPGEGPGGEGPGEGPGGA